MPHLKDFAEPTASNDANSSVERADRDVVILGIAIASIILFVGTGSAVLPQAIKSLMGIGAAPDPTLTSAVLLNLALILFGWRRYHDLTIEVNERRAAEEQARIQAETDPLTGCLNRRSVHPAADALIATAYESGENVAAIMVDLDNFKQVNDCHGHGAGDLLLKETALRMSRIMPERSLVARLGGDEFVCIVPFDVRDVERIDVLANALVEAVAETIELPSGSVDTTVSLGIAILDQTPEPPITADILLHRADIAMYHAKKSGRNRYSWYEPTMESELRFRNELESGIRRGISRGEFVPYYEQQVDLETGQLAGFEMLARWNSPTLGLVSPEVFIPVAEDVGLIAELSETLIRQALIDALEWDPSLTLSVNISPLQLRDPWFAQKLLKLLVAANFPPSRLEIEITETCLHENVGLVRTLITSLKNQGIRVSLDDFGTGYSSLAQLRTLPFDRIKIDRSFVTNLASNKESATIVEAITSLGEGLGMPITAEGIETEAVLERLMLIGKFKGQGYLYGRPQPADETQRKLADKRLLKKARDSELPAPALSAAEVQKQAGNGT